MNARLKITISMILYGTISLFVRRIPLGSAQVALLRALIALACLFAYKGVKGQPLSLRGLGGDLPPLALSGAAMGFNWIFLFEAYRHTTVSVATLSYYFAPVIVTVACPVLFHERLSKKQVACFVAATVGLVLVIDPAGLAGGGDPVRGVLFALAAAALYATVILLNKKIRRVSGLDRTPIQFMAAAAVLLPYVLLTGGVRLGGMTADGWLCLLILGAVHSGAAYALYFSALSALPGQEAAILSYVDPLVAVLVSLAVLHEPATPLQLAGGALILVFTLINELNPAPPSPAAPPPRR